MSSSNWSPSEHIAEACALVDSAAHEAYPPVNRKITVQRAMAHIQIAQMKFIGSTNPDRWTEPTHTE